MMRLHRWLKTIEDRALARFVRWFDSEGGVYQTFVLTMAVVIVELADRSLDPHAFALMAILTVYSAITQPALAYANGQSARETDARLDRIERALADLADHTITQNTQIAEQVHQLVTDLHDAKEIP